MQKVISGAFLAVMCTAVYTQPAYAYLDPGTGSMLLQGLIGSIAAAGAAGSLYYQQIKAKVSQMLSKNSSGDASGKTGE